MSVLSRPLFRQIGGPAQPMPQDMAPPQPQMDPEMARQAGVLEKAEMEARATGEQLGAEYAQNMMAGIDGAQSTEDLINALRGNDKPLEARREELAGYVGQSDANQTPESVLAMVQPVIMMTEEGMMDSGIGALVQQIAGDVEMTTADGAPTDMGMGVGSLMMAGAPEAPAPQNFRQGGEVAYLSNGSLPVSTAPPTFFETYSNLLSNYDYGSEVKNKYEGLRDVFSDIFSEEDRAQQQAEREEFDRAQALLSVARGGLRLAAGDPKSGGSLASQIGSAFEPTAAEIAALGAQAQDRRDERRQEDQRLRLARLQAGISAADRDRASQESLAIAAAKAEQPSSATTVLYSPTGKAFEFSDAEGNTQTLPAEIALPANDRSTQNQLLKIGYSTTAPKGEFSSEAIKARLSQPETLMLLKQGLVMGIEGPEQLRAQNDLASELKSNPITGAIDPIGSQFYEYAKLLQNPELRDRTQTHFKNMFNAFKAQGEDEAQSAEKASETAQEEVQATADLLANAQNVARDNSQDLLVQQFNEFMNNPSLVSGNLPKYNSPLKDYVDSRLAKIDRLNMSAATGLLSLPLSIIEYSVTQVANEFGGLLDSNAVSDSIAARRLFDSIMADTRRYFYSAPGQDHPLQQEFAKDEENFPKMSAFETDSNAREKVDNLAARIRTDVKLYQDIIDNRETRRGVTVDTALTRLPEAIAIETILNRIYQNYRFGRQRDIVTTDNQGQGGDDNLLSPFYDQFPSSVD